MTARLARTALLAACAIAVAVLARGQAQPAAVRLDPELERDVQSARRDLDQYWRARIQNYAPPADVVMFVAPATTDCGRFERPNAMYCSGTNKIYWDANMFMEQFKLGDFAPLFILGHEWGHLVQYRLGLFDSSRGLLSAQLELQADCLSAQWAADLQRRGLLDERDDDEAVASLRRTSGLDTPWFESKAHGTPGQRIDAFLFGFANRDCRSDQFFQFLKSQHGIDASRVPQTPTPASGALASMIRKQVGRFTLVGVQREEMPRATDFLDAKYRTSDGVEVEHGLASYASAALATQVRQGAEAHVKGKGFREISRQNVVEEGGAVLGERVLFQGAEGEIVYWTNKHLLGFTVGPNNLALELYRALPY